MNSVCENSNIGHCILYSTCSHGHQRWKVDSCVENVTQNVLQLLWILQTLLILLTFSKLVWESTNWKCHEQDKKLISFSWNFLIVDSHKSLDFFRGKILGAMHYVAAASFHLKWKGFAVFHFWDLKFQTIMKDEMEKKHVYSRSILKHILGAQYHSGTLQQKHDL